MAVSKKRISEMPKIPNNRLKDFIVPGVDRVTNENGHADMLQLKGNTAYQEWAEKNPDKTYEDWLAFIKGDKGNSVELQKTATHIQWREVGTTAWTNLIPVADLIGATGASIELQVSATHIQWRVKGDTAWLNLIAIIDLKGAKGDTGATLKLKKTATHIQWAVVGTEVWTDLIALADIKGEPGAGNVDITNSTTVEAGKFYALKPTTNGSQQYTAEKVNDLTVDWRAKNLTLAGAQKFDRPNIKICKNVAEYVATASALSGTIQIKMPVDWNSTMFAFKIKVWEWNPSHAVEYFVRAYNNTTGDWQHSIMNVMGENNPNKSIRLGYITADKKCCILIGKPATAWSYVKVAITEVYATWTGMSSDFINGWSTSLITDETGISGIVTPTLISRTLAPSEIATKLNIPQNSIPVRTGAASGEPDSNKPFSTAATASTIVQRTATAQVKVADAINNDEAVSKGQLEQRFEGVANFDYTEKPAIGQAGVIYYIPIPSTPNAYEKWQWVKIGGVWDWKDIGTTTIDLADYAKVADVNAALLTKADKSILKSATLLATGWTDDTAASGFYTYSVLDTDITAGIARIEFTPSTTADRTLMQDNGLIDLGGELAGGFMIKSEMLPTADININYILQQ